MKRYFLFLLVFLLCTTSISAQTANTSSGTGFFISENGIIVTCAHVVEDATRVTVNINNTEYTAQVLAKEPDVDLAILKINYANPNHFKIASFSTVNLGDKVSVLGFPLSNLLGSDIRLTDGSVSAKSGINADQTYFQLSAPIQPGNSGGPIFNSNFEIIGVAAAKLNDMATLAASGSIPQNINFGVKSEYIKGLLGSIRAGAGNVRNMNDATNATVYIVCYETPSASATGSAMTIANNTGYTVYYAYVSLSSDTSWGSDRLGSNILQSGQTLTVSSLTPNATYDIHLIDSDNDTYTKRNIRFSPNQAVEFTQNDIDNRQNTNSSSSDRPTIKIVNNTGYTIYYVYVSPSSAEGWQNDVLEDEVMLTTEYINVTLPYPLSHTNKYDIRLKDKDGDTYTKWNLTISPNQTIEFRISDLDTQQNTTPATSPTPITTGDRPSVRIFNKTGYTIYFLYISPSSTDGWGEDVLGDNSILHHNNYLDVRLAYPLSSVNKYDVKLEDNDGDTYTKWNVTITPNMTINFTIGDLD